MVLQLLFALPMAIKYRSTDKQKEWLYLKRDQFKYCISRASPKLNKIQLQGNETPITSRVITKTEALEDNRIRGLEAKYILVV